MADWCHRYEAPLKENLRHLFHDLLFAGPSQCPPRNIYSDDVPFTFSENDALNPELVGACGATGMELSLHTRKT